MTDDGPRTKPERQPAGPAVRILVWLSLPALLAALVLLHHWSPSELPVAAQPKCIFYLLTGLHCPGCGTGRALRLLANGEVLAALSHNLFLFVALPVLLYAYASWFLHLAGGISLPWRGLPLRLCWALVGFVLVFWVVRNLPWWPCTILAPPPHSWEHPEARQRGPVPAASDRPAPDTDGGVRGRSNPSPLGEGVTGDP